MTSATARASKDEDSARLTEIGGNCRTVAKKLGFSHFLYAYRIALSFTEPKQFILSGYPREWQQHYDANRYLLIDPVVTRALTSSVPYSWDDLDRTDPTVQRLFSEAAAYGLVHGLGAPVNGAYGSKAVLVLSRAEPLPVGSNERERLMQQALWYSVQIHEQLCSHLVKPNAVIERPKLTARERQCLKLAADGLSATSIGKKLHLSERTIIWYLNRAEQKLGVRTRQHAIARAVALGEIHSDCYPSELDQSAGFFEVFNV